MALTDAAIKNTKLKTQNSKTKLIDLGSGGLSLEVSTSNGRCKCCPDIANLKAGSDTSVLRSMKHLKYQNKLKYRFLCCSDISDRFQALSTQRSHSIMSNPLALIARTRPAAAIGYFAVYPSGYLHEGRSVFHEPQGQLYPCF